MIVQTDLEEGMSNVYGNPLVERYASSEMSYIFSDNFKFQTWRKCWLALAQAQKELGLEISEAQILEMQDHLTDIDYQVVEQYEQQFRHDVMAHLHHFGELCPTARPIMHLGATSCFVGDNTDILMLKAGLELLLQKLVAVIESLQNFALQHKDQPTLGFTHLQPAQLTTVGKRAALWLVDLMADLRNIERCLQDLKLRGVKGTTGTQASFLALFDGEIKKVQQLDILVTEKLGMKECLRICGQTYSRKTDVDILNALASLGSTMHKWATDLRLLCHLKEVEEPFGKNQIGSSAMAYKRNPMRSERVCSLSRFLMNLPSNALQTHSIQWMERSLDDSANRRLILGQAFLTADAILSIMHNVADGMVVYPKVIEQHIQAELPFMATENIIMAMVQKGGDRQDVHEKIRQHSMDASYQVKGLGLPNDLITRIMADAFFEPIHSEINILLEPSKFTGLAAIQVEEYCQFEVLPLIHHIKETYQLQNIQSKELSV